MCVILGLICIKRMRVVCFLNEDDTSHLETFPLSQTGISGFLQTLDNSDAVAVEVTQNIYYFYDQIKTFVARIIAR